MVQIAIVKWSGKTKYIDSIITRTCHRKGTWRKHLEQESHVELPLLSKRSNEMVSSCTGVCVCVIKGVSYYSTESKDIEC